MLCCMGLSGLNLLGWGIILITDFTIIKGSFSWFSMLQLKNTVTFVIFSHCLPHLPRPQHWAGWSAGRSPMRLSAWTRSPWRETCSGAVDHECLPHHKTTDQGHPCHCRRCCTHRPAELWTEIQVHAEVEKTETTGIRSKKSLLKNRFTQNTNKTYFLTLSFI